MDRREILPGFVVDRDDVRAVVCIPSGDAFAVRVDYFDGSAKATGCDTEEEGWAAIRKLVAEKETVPQTEG